MGLGPASSWGMGHLGLKANVKPVFGPLWASQSADVVKTLTPIGSIWSHVRLKLDPFEPPSSSPTWSHFGAHRAPMLQ